MSNYREDFIQFALQAGVLKFGDFTLKSGRQSPYFFNTGLFNTGAQLGKLGEFYAQALLESGLQPDVVFGPAYKGIPLACALAIAYARLTGKDLPFAFNRKEAKDHGEGGTLVGAPLRGKVLIVDDVITAGTSVRESVDMIRAAGAEPFAVLIALDRQERGPEGISAVQDVQVRYAMPVKAVVSLADIIASLQATPGQGAALAAVAQYSQRYGVEGPNV